MKYRLLFITTTLSYLLIQSAFADALDGDWCNARDGKLTIMGSTIQTPGGRSVSGQYTRHRFNYTAPEGDWNAGKAIVIQQLNENAMDLSIDGGPPSRWSPCLVTS